MHSIGAMARDSGLSVSALRFYDGAGVFGPARVDPQTGYRWYAPEQLADARLIARLRRVGMPLADISRVLAGDPADARLALDTHLRRLEDGLSDARRELSTVRTLLDLRENPMTATRLTVPAAELAAALDAVRFAVGSNPEMPAVTGILLEVESDTLRLVATDRYRLAISQARTSSVDGPGVSAIAPTAFADALRALLGTGAEAELLIDGDELTAEVAGNRISGTRIDQDYPDYRPLFRIQPAHQLPFEADTLRETLSSGATRTSVRHQDGVEYPTSVLTVAADGSLVVAGEEADGLLVGVNRDFLLEAIGAGGSTQLLLEFGGPITPLAIRFPDREGTVSYLMPTTLS